MEWVAPEGANASNLFDDADFSNPQDIIKRIRWALSNHTSILPEFGCEGLMRVLGGGDLPEESQGQSLWLNGTILVALWQLSGNKSNRENHPMNRTKNALVRCSAGFGRVVEGLDNATCNTDLEDLLQFEVHLYPDSYFPAAWQLSIFNALAALAGIGSISVESVRVDLAQADRPPSDFVNPVWGAWRRAHPFAGRPSQGAAGNSGENPSRTGDGGEDPEPSSSSAPSNANEQQEEEPEVDESKALHWKNLFGIFSASHDSESTFEFSYIDDTCLFGVVKKD